MLCQQRVLHRELVTISYTLTGYEMGKIWGFMANIDIVDSSDGKYAHAYHLICSEVNLVSVY